MTYRITAPGFPTLECDDVDEAKRIVEILEEMIIERNRLTWQPGLDLPENRDDDGELFCR